MLLRPVKGLLVFFLAFSGTWSFLFHRKGSPRFDDTGLPRRPKKIDHTVRRVPMYMLKLYEQLATKSGTLKREMPYNVNAIRGIYSKRLSKPSHASMEIFYDVGYLREIFAARRDEIHVYMHLANMDKNIFRPYVLKLHDIHSNRLIREYKVPAFNHGWQVLSLSGWTKRWLTNPPSNKGMRLTVYRGRREKTANSNPFIKFPQGKDPYLILFGDDSNDSISTLRFLAGFSLNSVAGQPPSRLRRMTKSHREHPQCKATKKLVSLKGKKIDDDHIVVEPERYKMTKCSDTCVTVPIKRSYRRSYGQSSVKLSKKFCCVPRKLRSMAFLVTEPSRSSVTFTTVSDVVAKGCFWSSKGIKG